MQHNVFIALMSLGTLGLNVLFVALVVGLLIPSWRQRVVDFVRKHALLIIFVLSAGCVVSTLFIEYVVLLSPCVLCWWQRIFMYPIPLIAGVALIKNTSFADIADYVLVLVIPGAAVSLYQHLLQMLPAGALIPCDASGECAVRSVFEFGYITLPWMALSAFALFALIALIARKKASY